MKPKGRYNIRLAERREPDAETLAAEQGPTRDRLQREARQRVLERWAQVRQAELQRSGRVVQLPLYPASR